MDPKSAASNGRVIVVTGAGGGLGGAFARRFGEHGASVLVADLDHASAQATADALAADGVRAQAVRVDVSDGTSTEELAEAAKAFSGGRVHVLINNAAIYGGLRRAPFDEITEDEWDRVLSVNLKGVWLVTRALSPLLGEGSHIVNVSSATVFSGSANWAHYVASKAGVIGLTRALATELGPRGISVNAVAPGFTLTDASRDLVPGAETYGVERSALRRAIQPDDIVGAVEFLASENSGFVTGQTLIVDGGRQFI
ncbi:SDR family NAD(P)-dependent oxidoreductase [Pseudolysinimonas sp.]